jgi:flavin-dependent dehydrogenase
MEAGRTESADVVIVGARCAGSATAIPLAAAGRSVVVLDGASFPSDTLSTHLLFPSGVAELVRLGAIERVRALGAPALPVGMLWAPGVTVRGGYTPVDGIEHGWCVRRTGLDNALVETARAEGADVRERVRVTDVVRDDGRVAGVRYRERDGAEGAIRARLVVGADGRRSTLARLVDARPWLECPNGRIMFYAYFTDPNREWREIAAQWRSGRELCTVFPCDGDGRESMLVLEMPPATRADEFRADTEAAWERTIAGIPELAERLRGAERLTKLHSSREHPAFFRRSSGPGWALTGDAGHFKDPVTAQGIRDALRFGRKLGEAVAPSLDDETRLAQALRVWEDERDRECLEVYQWSNVLGHGDDVSAIEFEAYRALAASPTGAREALDVFSRMRRPREVFTAGRVATWTVRALRRPGADRRAILRVLAREAGRELAAARERITARRHKPA